MSFGGWPPGGNPFQQNQATAPSSVNTGTFGSSGTSMQSSNVFSIFGQKSTTFAGTVTSSMFSGTTAPSVFGGSSSQSIISTTSAFGGTDTSSVFGGTTAPSVFGGSSNQAIKSTTSAFGGTGTSSVFGGTTAPSAFGGSANPASVFGGSSVFGAQSAQQIPSFTQSGPTNVPSSTSQSLNIFQQNQPTQQPPKLGSLFGERTQQSGALKPQVGQLPQSSAFQSSTSVFGGTASVFGGGQKNDPPKYPGPQKSVFMANPTPFSAPSVSAGSSNPLTSVFGVPSQNPTGMTGSTSLFGSEGHMTETTIFGQTRGQTSSLFGIKTPEPQKNVKGSIFMSNLPRSGQSTGASSPKNVPSVFDRLSQAKQPVSGQATSKISPTGQFLREGGVRRKRSLDDMKKTPVLGRNESSEDSSEAVSKRPSMQAFSRQDDSDQGGMRRQISQKIVAMKRSSVMSKRPGELQGMVSRARKPSTSAADVAAMQTTHTIVCHEIPPDVNNRDILKRHFSKFGVVLRINISLEKSAATVTFSDNEAARRAKAEGSRISESHPPMKIFFSKKPRRSTDKVPGKEISPEIRQPQSRSAVGHKLPMAHQPLTRLRTQKSPIIAPMRRSRSPRPIYAKTDEEKLEILEKIDQLLRKQVVKQSDIKKAKVSKGTCPDMCPEKERYLRQERKLLALYETEEGTLDHTKAIKEYSRSSADQEEPLPHDLRPAEVLKMTMNYILCEIIPKIEEGQVAEWYDFVWNRTRAIRKELTIQQINNPTAVEINEKCARFHIFCAHHFCAEDRMVFDPKINNENLEKTMKTILDLYHDVYFTKSREGQQVSLENSNVAEFYAYYILLNINRTADVLNELQELPPVVRSSPDIGLAVEAFMSVHSNNYAKFFKIVRRATYLQGCILHRYFAQVRRKAALTIARAFAPSNKTVHFPVVDFARVLCFNDENELNIFCQHYSLALNEEMVELSRSMDEQEGTMFTMRSNLVSMKLNNESLGEIIANHQLEMEEYVPYSSFDDNGRYIGEHLALLSSDNPVESFQAIAQVQEPPRREEATSQTTLPPGVSNMVVKIIAKELFHEVIDELCLQMSKETLEAIHCTFILKEVLDDVILYAEKDLCDEVIKEENLEKERKLAEELAKRRELEEQKRIKEEKEREEERKRIERELERKRELERQIREREKMKLEQTAIIASQLQKQVEDDIIKLVAMETHEEEKEILRQRRIETWSTEELDVDINEVVMSLLYDITKKTMKELKKEQCKEIFHEIQTRKLERCFEKWIKVKDAKIRFQNAKRTFPSVPYSRPIREQIQALLPNQNARSKSRKRGSFPLDETSEASLRSPMNIVETRNKFRKYLEETVDVLSYLYKEANTPLPFCKIFQENYKSHENEAKNELKNCWKLAVSLPDSISGENDALLTWIKKKFLGEEKELCVFENDDNKQNQVSVCCRLLSSEPKKEEIVGSFGLVFGLLPPYLATEKDYWQHVRNKIENFISLNPGIPQICMLILTIGWDVELEVLVQKLGLSLLDFAICDYAHYNLTNDVDAFLQNNQDLYEGVKFLVQNSPPPPQLVTQTLRELFENELSSNYITPLYRHISVRQRVQMSPLDGSYQIEFYNSVIESLSSTTNRNDFAKISWPPPELVGGVNRSHLPPKDWNTEDTLTSNYEAMLKCQVPEFPEINENLNEEEITDILVNYGESVCPNCPTLRSVLKRKINLEFERIYNTFDLVSDVSFDDPNLDEKSIVRNFRLHSIIDCIISQHLTNLLYLSPLGNRKITYPVEVLNYVETPPEFADLFNEFEFYSINERYDSAGKEERIHRMTEKDEFLELEDSCFEESKVDTSWLYPENEKSEILKKTGKLCEEIKNEQKLNSKYEERLKAILEEGNSPLTFADSSALSRTLLYPFND